MERERIYASVKVETILTARDSAKKEIDIITGGNFETVIAAAKAYLDLDAICKEEMIGEYAE